MSEKSAIWFLPLRALRRLKGLSEEQFSKQAHLSRSTLRSVESKADSLRVASISSALDQVGLELQLLASPLECDSEMSTIAAGYQVLRDGFLSWKIHYFNLVDEFRRTLDPGLLLLPPPRQLDRKLTALLASIVWQLAHEADIEAPYWAKKRYFLEEAWFVSGSESLKASTLTESPIYFRRNNIFVLSNFLERK